MNRTAPAAPKKLGSSRFSRSTRWAALPVVLLGLVGGSLGLTTASASAVAAPNTVDQITGAGVTDSAITMKWADGLTGLDNKPLGGARDPQSAGYLGDYMYEDFKNLSLTVSQTEGLASQAISLKWSGMKPSDPTQVFQRNYLQVMECWGDAAAGPDPENCQFGSLGMQVSGTAKATVGLRAVYGRKSGDPAYPGATGDIGKASVVTNYDPAELALADKHVNIPEVGSALSEVPFRPFTSPDSLAWGTDAQAEYFNKNTSNELQGAGSGTDGTGEALFEVQTATEAPHLGCGKAEKVSSGVKARSCWLVVVPRGEHLSSGLGYDEAADNAGLWSSPLSATNWAQRIQVRLGFKPVGVFCPTDAVERRMVGTELVARLVSSYQPVLCGNGGSVYGYATAPDTVTRRELLSTSDGASGIGFSTVAITRGPSDPPLVYAPVAVSALTFGFSIDSPLGNGPVPTMKLTPRLVAKALTQSYRSQIPGVNKELVPAWAKGNPFTIAHDPEFQRLNAGAIPASDAWPGLRLMVPVGNSAEYTRIWHWLQADPAAKAWLGGKADADGMVINPVYTGTKGGDLRLDTTPAPDNFPKSDPTCYRDPNPELGIPADKKYCSLDLNPYVNSLNRGALQVRRANDGAKVSWDLRASAPDGSTGWYVAGDPMHPGVRRNWTVTDSTSATQYGLQMAALCKSDGSECVSPTIQSLGTSVSKDFSTSKEGVLVPKATVSAGAYPLTVVTHAVVRGNQSKAGLLAAATLLDYVAGPGQKTGTGLGALPLGYLPLPKTMVDQVKVAAATLRANTKPTPPTTPPATSTSVRPTEKPSTPAGPSSTPANGGGGVTSSTATTTSVTPTTTAVSTTSSVPTTSSTPDLPGDDDNGSDPEESTPESSAPESSTAKTSPSAAAASVPQTSPAASVDPTVSESVALVAQPTPAEPMNFSRYVLAIALFGGVLGAVAGPALLRVRAKGGPGAKRG